ncbi:MAG: hypothetical protein IJV15_09995 [Lachnospiraceae bacterium]|nr:hypothetical protein [Lachnospiraceae bacterium]
MNNISIHNKVLPIPSFFQVFNYGGGAGDKTRELVYAGLSDDTPALLNYYYINNNYTHSFQSPYFNNILSFDKIGDALNYVTEQIITKDCCFYKESNVKPYDFNQKVILLDSGSSNIVKYVAKECDYNIEKFKTKIVEHAINYYDFANKLKVDMVVAFDLGGKYTFKDDEANNVKLQTFYRQLDNVEINHLLLVETIKYLIRTPNFYPYVLATVHGNTPNNYKNYTKEILKLEDSFNYHFFGFALGGIASSKNIDASWYEGIDLPKNKKARDATLPARAINIVHNIVGNRYIHALGCGGYPNIPLNYYCGASSFDAASPARRVGDGNGLSTSYIFSPKSMIPAKAKFSKYFVGGYNADGSQRKEDFDYTSLYNIENDLSLCGCNACKKVNNINELKQLYAQQADNAEAFYYAKQLMNVHAILQHRKLCQIIAQYGSMEDFCIDNPNKLNRALLSVYKQLVGV